MMMENIRCGRMASSLSSPVAVNLHHPNSSLFATTNPQLPSIRLFSSGNCQSSHAMSSRLLSPRNCNLWRGRCAATSPHPPSPPESGPPPGEEQDSNSGGVASFSRFEESVKIYFAVFFWMSLFFWSSVWDGRNNDKGPRFWK